MKQNNTANASSEEPNLFYNATCWLFCILFTLKRHCDVRTSSANDVRSFLSRSYSFFGGRYFTTPYPTSRKFQNHNFSVSNSLGLKNHFFMKVVNLKSMFGKSFQRI